jgi:putative colanic acid biosynthesis glycosyltransferase
MISVVTVVKDDLVGIKNTFKSLHSQTDQSFEWVIIDAISKDGTMEFVSSLDATNIKIISEKDSGIYDAMNKGIIHSNGKYLFFLNAGDFLVDKDVISHINSILDQNEFDIIYGSVFMRFGKNLFKRGPKKNINAVLNSLPGHHQATFYKTKLLKEFSYDLKYNFSGDYYISAILYKNGFRNYYFTDKVISEFEVGHHSYKNLFKIWKYSNDIQKNILKIRFFNRFLSCTKRLVSSILLVIYFKFSKHIKL